MKYRAEPVQASMIADTEDSFMHLVTAVGCFLLLNMDTAGGSTAQKGQD